MPPFNKVLKSTTKKSSTLYAYKSKTLHFPKKYKKVIDNEERGVVVFRRYLPQGGRYEP